MKVDLFELSGDNFGPVGSKFYYIIDETDIKYE